MTDNHEQITKDVRIREKPKRKEPTDLRQRAISIIKAEGRQAVVVLGSGSFHYYGHKGQFNKAVAKRRRQNQIAKVSRRRNRG